MRDTELLIDLLRRMASDEAGRIMIRKVYGRSQKERHHAELLTDAGHADWVSEQTLRITTHGYDFLNAIDNQPKALDGFIESFEKGVTYAQ